MTAYLVENPPKQRQFKARGTTPSGVVVVHTAESVPDTVGPDSGAEGVARFIRNRSDFGSYHDLCDSDGIVQLVPYNMQAYGDGTGTNPHAYHVSAATQAAKWATLPREWRDDTVRNMARAAARFNAFCKANHGFTIPARRVTRDQSSNRVEGFISHAERDPGRRSDPGKGFAWDLFLETYSDLAFPKPDAPTRGPRIDRALRNLNRVLVDLDEAHGSGARGALIDLAERRATLARRDLRRVKFLEEDK